MAYVDEMEEYADVSKNILPCQLDLLENIASKIDKIYFFYFFWHSRVHHSHSFNHYSQAHKITSLGIMWHLATFVVIS
jgi:hypothetical protein